MTVQPSTCSVPPARSASASSMQSPPARADATRVIILSPTLARPGARPSSRCRSTNWGRPSCWASVAGRISPALLTKRWSSKATWMRRRPWRGSISWVLLLSGWFSVTKTIIREGKEHFLTLSTHRHSHLFGGFGLRGRLDRETNRFFNGGSVCRCQLYFVALAITSPSESGYWRTCSEDGLYGHSPSVVCDSGNPPAGVEEREIAEFISNSATRSEGSMGSSRIALRNGRCVNHDAFQGRCQIGLPRRAVDKP